MKAGTYMRNFASGFINSYTINSTVSSRMTGMFAEDIGGLNLKSVAKERIEGLKRSTKLFSLYQNRQLAVTDDEGHITDFTTSLHYYKRNLTPLKESFPTCNDRTPYHSNFENFQGNLISQDFKKEMLNCLGKGNTSQTIKCLTSMNKRRPDSILQTFISIEGVKPVRKPKRIQSIRENKVQKLCADLDLADEPIAPVLKKEPAQWITRLKNKKEELLMINQNQVPKKHNYFSEQSYASQGDEEHNSTSSTYQSYRRLQKNLIVKKGKGDLSKTVLIVPKEIVGYFQSQRHNRQQSI